MQLLFLLFCNSLQGKPEMSTELKKRSYDLRNGGELSFDPQKDLNLPSSYEEVVSRFERIQGVRKVNEN